MAKLNTNVAVLPRVRQATLSWRKKIRTHMYILDMHAVTNILRMQLTSIEIQDGCHVIKNH